MRRADLSIGIEPGVDASHDPVVRVRPLGIGPIAERGNTVAAMEHAEAELQGVAS